MNPRETIFSPCRKYRYTLRREWDASKPYCQFIGLNPSTADETKDDPTIRRCIAFARSWGYGALCMTNLFAWRDTDPKKMMKAANPVGQDNQHWLLSIGSQAGIIVAAWGTKGVHQCMDLTAKQWLSQAGLKLHCLRKTDAGHPEHPLYLPKILTPIPL